MALDYSPPNKSSAKTSPTDSLQPGAHLGLRSSSRHRQMVSAPLHLKHSSSGAVGKTAYTPVKVIKAFGQSKIKKVK